MARGRCSDTGEPVNARTTDGLPIVRRRVRVEGIVQGVGFRPFVYSLGTGLGLAGHVVNDARGVTIEAEGPADRVSSLIDALCRDAPPLAVLDRIRVTDMNPTGARGFVIRPSRTAGDRWALVAPDIATCPDCLRELFDPADRRHRYPFINCSNCGPRFTIVCGVPYDRALTTMAAFDMCAACAREYHDPADRRFHAQPVSCPACGPRLRLVDRSGGELPGDPIRVAVERLQAGGIVAVKGLGGYHFAAMAANEDAVATLRKRKHREDKPFAVMVPDLAAASRLADIDTAEARALASPRRPIILLRRSAGADLAPSLAPQNRQIGLMLPYTPIHHLLSDLLRAPFVLTSGNISDEPIACDDADALARLAPIADAFLAHDRAIHTRTDDSVIRVFRGREMPSRRARGYAPQPLILPWRAPRPILACGPELKNTFCLMKGRHAYLSHHIGDLENYATLRAFTDGIEHFRRLFAVSPEVVAYDLHPEYLSTTYALDFAGVKLIGVQHHHAHIAACLADNRHEGPVIGVAFDGLGYGTDGTLWGGEFLVADFLGFVRAAHLAPVPMPGGTAAIHQPWRMAAAYLAGGDRPRPPDLDVSRRNRSHWQAVTRLAQVGVASPLTSSVGRLFDAVAAILGVRDEVHYEGQAAIELEQLARPSERAAYPLEWTDTDPIRIEGAALVRAVVEDLHAGRAPGIVAARFHNSVARMIAGVCAAIRTRTGLTVVALSGGVFQNLLLLERALDALADCGFKVLTHSRVPCNDGGVSLGQAVIAAARCRRPPGAGGDLKGAATSPP